MKVTAPGKLILFGEWAVLLGQPALSTAVDKKFTLETSQLEEKLIQYSSNNHGSKSIGDLSENVDGFFSWAHRCLQQISHEHKVDISSIHFDFDRAWDLSEGLGSSSALFLTLNIWAQKNYFKKIPGADILPQWREALRSLQNGKGSGLDLCTQFLGGSVILENNHIEGCRIEKPEELLLVHSGNKMDTHKALHQIQPSQEWALLIGNSVRDFLKDHNYERSIETHYGLLEKLGVIPEWLGELRSTLKSKKLISSLKSCGAGGGDSLLIWSPKPRQEELISILKSKGFWLNNAAWNAAGVKVELSHE